MSDQKKRNLFLIGAAALALIALLTGWYFAFRKGVEIGDDFFYKVSDTMYRHDKSTYIEALSDHDFKIVSADGVKTASIHADDMSVTLDFSDGESLTGFWNGAYLQDADDLPFGWDSLSVTAQFSDGTSDPEPAVGSVSYGEAICRIYFGQEAGQSVWYIPVVGVIFYIVGILTVLYPEEMHFLFDRWRYRNPELSPNGILLEQISGIALCIAGLAFMSSLFFLFIN